MDEVALNCAASPQQVYHPDHNPTLESINNILDSMTGTAEVASFAVSCSKIDLPLAALSKLCQQNNQYEALRP